MLLIYWRRAQYCYGKVVCLSVTLRYRDHLDWNFSKLITPLVSMGCSLFADPNIMDLLQGDHHEILTGIGKGYDLTAF